MPLTLRLPFWIATFAACSAAVAYVLTFWGITYYPVLFLLPVLIVTWLVVMQLWRRVPRRNLRSEIFGDIPRWMKGAAAGLLLFAFVNCLACLALNSFARPQRLTDGRTVLQLNKQIVRELSPVELRYAEARQLRMLTGFFVCCFGLAALLVETCWIKNGPAMADRKI